MKCITEHPGFQSTCLDVWVLETAYYVPVITHSGSSTAHRTDNHTGNKYVYFYFNYRGSIVRFSSAVTGFISVLRTLVKMVISLYSSGRATLFTGLHRGVEHDGIDLISHCTFVLSVTVSTCVPLQKGFTTSVTLIFEKNYSKHGKSKNLFISVEMSFLPTLATVLRESRTIEVQYSTASLHPSSQCRAGFRALRLLHLPWLPSNWLCHNHSIIN